MTPQRTNAITLCCLRRQMYFVTASSDLFSRPPQRVMQVNIIAEEEGAPSVADIIGRPLLAAEDVKGEDLLAIKVSN